MRELPIREDLLELIRLLELLVCGRVTRGLNVVLELIELPILDDLLELMRLLELFVCGLVTRGLDALVLIEPIIREDRLELIRLLELDDDGLLILIELLDGLRALEVTPDRIVGRLTVVLLDWLLVLLLLGMRMLNLLVDLLELLLRGALLLKEILLLEEILLRPEDLGVTVLVGVLLIDREREEVADREELALAEEDCRLLEAEEDLEDCRLLELLWLELLLLLDDFSAKTGLMVSIKAKNNIPTTILTFFRDFIVAIILLLKYLT